MEQIKLSDLVLNDGTTEKVPAEFHRYLSQVQWRMIYWTSDKGKPDQKVGTDLTPVGNHRRTGHLRNVIRNLVKIQQSDPQLLEIILQEKFIRPELFYPTASPFWVPPIDTID